MWRAIFVIESISRRRAAIADLDRTIVAEMSERCVRHGGHTAVRALEKAMLDYLDQRKNDPKPFVWTAHADLIVGTIERVSERISEGRCRIRVGDL